MTLTFHGPIRAEAGMPNVHRILPGLSTETLVAGIAGLPVFVRNTFAPVTKPDPDRLETVTNAPSFPEAGTMVVTAGAVPVLEFSRRRALRSVCDQYVHGVDSWIDADAR
jgi:hypothetical protein